jgi:cytochrome c oxidase subunit 4
MRIVRVPRQNDAWNDLGDSSGLPAERRAVLAPGGSDLDISVSLVLPDNLRPNVMDAPYVSPENKAMKEPSGRSYVVVWLVLLAMTALTVLAASLNLAGVAIVVCLGIAAFKSTLVLLYFMHLRYEDRLLVKLLMPIAITTLAIFIGLTYSDVIFR